MSITSAKEQVLKVYPGAVKQLHGVLCYIQDGRDGDALGYSTHSFDSAWQNALTNLNAANLKTEL